MMHKKGFEELVEGAEVAYYVRGEVVVSCVENNDTIFISSNLLSLLS